MIDRYIVAFVALSLAVLAILFFYPIEAKATRYDPDIEVNINDITEVTEVVEINTITSGVSDSDLAKGLSAAGASGGHQFDFGTHDWQGSIVGAWYDDEDAVSFGIGKRWEKVDALFHGSYTQNGSDDLFVIGGTFRF